jgi:hypothetical protein
MENGALATAVVLASGSRLESLAVLRLRVAGRQLIGMPMAPQHFHFLRRAPHACVSIISMITQSAPL